MGCRSRQPGYDRAEVTTESQIELTRRAIDAFNSNNAEAMIELGVLAFDWTRDDALEAVTEE